MLGSRCPLAAIDQLSQVERVSAGGDRVHFTDLVQIVAGVAPDQVWIRVGLLDLFPVPVKQLEYAPIDRALQVILLLFCRQLLTV